MAETLFFLGEHDLLEKHTQFIEENDIVKDRVAKTL